jgi:hypothetical protein
VHTTRRTCASLLVALDIHPRVGMQILPDSQIAVTMNVYSEAPSQVTRTPLKRLGCGALLLVPVVSPAGSQLPELHMAVGLVEHEVLGRRQAHDVGHAVQLRELAVPHRLTLRVDFFRVKERS